MKKRQQKRTDQQFYKCFWCHREFYFYELFWSYSRDGSYQVAICKDCLAKWVKGESLKLPKSQ